MSDPSAEDHREAVREEYSQFVAAEVIDLGGARAFNVGDAVPKSHVERGVVDASQVRPASEVAAPGTEVAVS